MCVKQKIRLIRQMREEQHIHKYYTDETWGYAGNYDLCLDACRLGVDGVIDIVLQYIKKTGMEKD